MTGGEKAALSGVGVDHLLRLLRLKLFQRVGLAEPLAAPVRNAYQGGGSGGGTVDLLKRAFDRHPQKHG